MNYFLFIKDYWIRKHTSAPNVLDTAKTIELIVENNLSVSRFGDGELDLILGINHPKFQNASSLLAYKLKMILSNPPRTSGCLVCLPKIFTMNDLAIFNKKARHHFFKFISRNRSEIYNHIDFKYIYGNAQFTRQYIDLKDKSKSKEYFVKVKQIWENKAVVIIEGRFTRFGVGNDLLSNARSVRRILCP